jgi:hypothetical protein
MALWTYTVNGLNVNDGANFLTVDVPELDNVAPKDVVLVPMAGDFPWFVRSQPREGTFTLNLVLTQEQAPGHYIACDDAGWQTRMALLRAALVDGIFPFTQAAHGATTPKSVQVAYQGMATRFKLRLVSIQLLAPNPNFT